MQSRIHATLVTLLAVTCLSLTLPASADQGRHDGHDRAPDSFEQPHGGHHSMHGAHGMRFLHGLDLSEAQQDAIFNLMHRQAPEVRKQQQALEKAQEALHQLTRQDRFDESQGRRLAKEIGDLKSEMAYQHARTQQEVYHLLTAVQRKQVEERQSGTFEPAACRKDGRHAANQRM